jgi:hypothetical protein
MHDRDFAPRPSAGGMIGLSAVCTGRGGVVARWVGKAPGPDSPPPGDFAPLGFRTVPTLPRSLSLVFLTELPSLLLNLITDRTVSIA